MVPEAYVEEVNDYEHPPSDSSFDDGRSPVPEVTRDEPDGQTEPEHCGNSVYPLGVKYTLH